MASPTFSPENPRIGAPKRGAKEKESVEKMMAREAGQLTSRNGR